MIGFAELTVFCENYSSVAKSRVANRRGAVLSVHAAEQFLAPYKVVCIFGLDLRDANLCRLVRRLVLMYYVFKMIQLKIRCFGRLVLLLVVFCSMSCREHCRE